MGIFDSYFNPQSYRDQGYQGLAGILGQLPLLQAQQGASTGFPGDNGSLPNNAQQMTGPPLNIVPQMPAAPAAPTPQQEPGFGDRLMGGLQGFIGNLHNGPIGAIAGGLGSLATGQRTDAGGIEQNKVNQTVQALVQRGFDPVLAKTVASDPGLLRAVLPQVMGIGGQTEDIKNYEYAKKQEPGLTWQQYQQRKRAGAGEYGMQPIWGTINGKPAAVQLGKGGVSTLAQMPEGFEVARDPIKIDAGTHFNLLDPQTRQIVGTVPKDLKGAEAAKALGTAQGTAQGELPAAVITAERTIKQIDDFTKAEGFNEVFGALDQYRPNWTMSDKGRDALSRFKQMSGRAFLEGRSMLKGGGAITDFESDKAEKAIARLERSLSEDDAKQALEDFKEAVREGAQKLSAKAGVVSPAIATAPKGGSSVNASDPLGLR